MPGLLRGLARTALVAGTATAVSNRVSRRQAGRWARHDQQETSPQEQEQPEQEPAAQEQGAQEQAAPGPGGGMDAVLAQLKQLGELKSQGVLSEAEFEQQKRRILGS